MTGWIIFGCIVLFFVFLFTVHAYVTMEMAEEMALTVRILGIPIKILPKKPTTYNPKHYTLKKIRKRDAKAAKKAGTEQFESRDYTAGQMLRRPSLSPTMQKSQCLRLRKKQ